MSSLNKVTLIGRLGKDPEGRALQSGQRMVNLTVATSESWTAKDGSRSEKTEWHRVTIWDEKIAEFAEANLTKGSLVYLEGALTTRKYTDQSGAEKYVTEVVLNKFRSTLIALEGGSKEERPAAKPAARGKPAAKQQWGTDDLSDEIPF